MLIESDAMRIVALWIPAPFRNLRSWMLLFGIVLLWAMALTIAPSSGTDTLGLRLPPCPFRLMTGILCPFCGISRGCAWMARGRLVAAWSSNILSPFLMAGSLLGFGYIAVFRFCLSRSLRFEPESDLRSMSRIILLIAVAISWIVNLTRS